MSGALQEGKKNRKVIKTQHEKTEENKQCTKMNTLEKKQALFKPEWELQTCSSASNYVKCWLSPVMLAEVQFSVI